MSPLSRNIMFFLLGAQIITHVAVNFLSNSINFGQYVQTPPLILKFDRYVPYMI